MASLLDYLTARRRDVTFSDDIVSILRKYGLAGAAALGAGGGALNLGMGVPPQQNGL